MAQDKAKIMFKQLPIPTVNSQFFFLQCVISTMCLFAPAFSWAEAEGFFHVPEECVRKAVFMLRDFINITSQAVVPRDHHSENETLFLCVIGPSNHQAET